MEYRPLGSTGLSVSAVSFGAGPVSGLMTGGGEGARQRETIARAIEAGVNWFDTAATYGDGESERNLGAALRELGASSRVHVATKVRLAPDQLGNIREHVKSSVRASLGRLHIERIALLQLHNAVTRRRGDQHTSITPADMLGPDGVLCAFRELHAEGAAAHLGLTGLGDVGALREVVRCGEFETMQVCYNILNPSAARGMPPGFPGEDYGEIIRECVSRKMGAIAIRVFAGGALTGQPPSQHTRKTRFFPLALYERDVEQTARLRELLPAEIGVKEAALRFVLGAPGVATALIGFACPEQVDEAVGFAKAGRLPNAVVKQLDDLYSR